MFWFLCIMGKMSWSVCMSLTLALYFFFICLPVNDFYSKDSFSPISKTAEIITLFIPNNHYFTKIRETTFSDVSNFAQSVSHSIFSTDYFWLNRSEKTASALLERSRQQIFSTLRALFSLLLLLLSALHFSPRRLVLVVLNFA